jgi:hypothetical protein
MKKQGAAILPAFPCLFNRKFSDSGEFWCKFILQLTQGNA